MIDVFVFELQRFGYPRDDDYRDEDWGDDEDDWEDDDWEDDDYWDDDEEGMILNEDDHEFISGTNQMDFIYNWGK